MSSPDYNNPDKMYEYICNRFPNHIKFKTRKALIKHMVLNVY